MNEFNLIDYFFKQHALTRPEVVYGIGDDCACLRIPNGQDLLVSTDTLVSDVHFLSTWDPYDIAYKAVMVNISDCAAMAAEPFALTLALTLPTVEEGWLSRFSQGLVHALNLHQIALIGGDTTRGPLSLTITIHGLAPYNKAVRRSGAEVGDVIYLTGPLGLAAFGVKLLSHTAILRAVTKCGFWRFASARLLYKKYAHSYSYVNIFCKARWRLTEMPKTAFCDRAKYIINSEHQASIKKALHHPVPRTDFTFILREFASSAIDVSDGLLADLNHLWESSGLGATLDLQDIPVHPLIQPLSSDDHPFEFALSGGDDYELCYIMPKENEAPVLEKIKSTNLSCYKIGVMDDAFTGLRGLNLESQYVQLSSKGYTHF